MSNNQGKVGINQSAQNPAPQGVQQAYAANGQSSGIPVATLPPITQPERPMSHAERTAGTYKPKSIGYPVARPDMTWHDLTLEQRQTWMRQHEARWKQRFGRQGGDMQPDLSLSRG